MTPLRVLQVEDTEAVEREPRDAAVRRDRNLANERVAYLAYHDRRLPARFATGSSGRRVDR